MIEEKLIEFCSKHCKSNIHSQCHVVWNGFGFEVICNCSCHKKEEMLDESTGLSNISNDNDNDNDHQCHHIHQGDG